MNQTAKPLVSIILRSFNEERWIGTCLEAIVSQTYKNFEIILVDNNSKDLTVGKAKQYPVQILTIDKFKPGQALNIGIRESKGELIVCLSAHCIPTNEFWLENLVRNFSDEKVAAAYGRQEPMSFTPDGDKRDLLTVFGLDRRIQWKDSFFHNANSMLRRKLWEEIPFDENISNIEDRLWAREILKKGLCIIYEPEASVYHHHGIHQNQEPERCANVVRIIEGLYKQDGDLSQYKHVENLKVSALIPVKGEVIHINGKSLLEYTINYLKKSKLITTITLTTDSEEYVALAKKLGVDIVIKRSASLSKEFVDLMAVYQDAIVQLEKMNHIPDIVVPIEITFPFREMGLIDKMITTLVEEGHDVVVPAKAEFGSCWLSKENVLQPLSDGFVPRKFKEPIWVGLKGVGIATYPGRILKGNLFSGKIKLMQIENQLTQVEIRNANDDKVVQQLIHFLDKE